MVKRRASEGFNLAFLDIMACGLGAIVLVFMLVKKNIDNSGDFWDIVGMKIIVNSRTKRAVVAEGVVIYLVLEFEAPKP